MEAENGPMMALPRAPVELNGEFLSCFLISLFELVDDELLRRSTRREESPWIKLGIASVSS